MHLRVKDKVNEKIVWLCIKIINVPFEKEKEDHCIESLSLSLLTSFLLPPSSLFSHLEIQIEGHTGIVKCLACSGNKVYSGGFDQKLIIYEASSMPVDHTPPLRCLHVNHHAHDAGITCIIVAKDADSSTWWTYTCACKLYTMYASVESTAPGLKLNEHFFFLARYSSQK